METTLYFTREFTRGILKGIFHNDKIEFVNVERAMEWKKGVDAKAKRGKLDYKIADCSFQNYTR